VIDDLGDRQHDADCLLDQTYGRDAANYRPLVPERCTILTGAQYALLQQVFAAERPAALARRNANTSSVRRILITLGNSDPDNVTGVVLEAIRMCDLNVAVDVVLGATAPHLDRIRQQIELLPWARLLVDVKDMASLMAAADLAIGAGGTTSWERCCLGLPSLSITTAENQKLVNRNLGEKGAVRIIGRSNEVTADSVAAELVAIVAMPESLSAMSAVASKICDGRGAMRVTLVLLNKLCTSDDVSVGLRLLEAEDESMLLGWQQAEGVRRIFRTTESPEAATHHAWMLHRMQDLDSLSTIINYEGRSAGLLRLDPGPEGKIEVAILIAPEFWGRGIASNALRLAREVRPHKELWAQIHPDNMASVRVFERAGFKPAGRDGWYRAPELAEV